MEENYPEAAPYTSEAVDKHDEELVIENYFPKVVSLGTVMDIPPINELPFFDEAKHEAPTEQEKCERTEAYRAYRENFRNGTKPGDE